MRQTKKRKIYLSYIFGVLLITSATFCFTHYAQAAYGDTNTLFGKMYTGDGKIATEAYLDMPFGFTKDNNGNIFIADTYDNVIRKIDADNIITTYSGTGEFGRQDGFRPLATWGYPKGIAYDPFGNSFYVADTGNSRIRKIDANNNVSTISTTSSVGFLLPEGILCNGSDLYIADTGHNRIVKMSNSGGELTEIATGLNMPLKMVIAGEYLFAVDFGSASILKININSKSKTILASNFTEPRAITYYNNYLYATAGENGMWNEIWKINPANGAKELLISRVETELLNNGSDMFVREDNGSPRLYILQSGGSSVQTFDINGGDIQLFAGRHRYGDETGHAGQLQIGRPVDLTFSPDGKYLYIVYAQGNKIAVYDLWNDQLNHLAGHLMDNYKEGVGDNSRFSGIVSIAISKDGKILYIVDRNDNRVRKLNTKTGQTSYITGAGEINSNNNINNGYQEGSPCPDEFNTGINSCAYFNRPSGLALTNDEKTLYVADTSNNRVRKVDLATGQTSFIAGSGSAGFADGTGNQAAFNSPYTMALSPDERTLYVVDKNNNAVRTINLNDNSVTTLVGKGNIGYREGSFDQAVLAIPENIKMGPDGNLYLSEAGSFRVRKLDLAARTTSLVSGSGERGHINGSKEIAEWDAPKGMAFLNSFLYVTDFRNDLIRTVDMDNTIPSPSDTISDGKGFMAYDPRLRGGWAVAVGNVTGDEAKEIITGTGAGFGPHIRIFDENGKPLASFFAYASDLRAGVRVTAGDLDRDGYDEIITVPGPGAVPHIRIFDGSGQPDAAPGFFALDGKFKGGAYIASGDVDGDGKAEIVVAAGRGGGPHITVHQASGKVIANFFAYNKDTFRYGITVATFDSDGNGKDEIIVGPEYGSPHIQFFTLRPGEVKLLDPGFFAFDKNYKGGVYVAGADYDGNGVEEMVIGAGIGMQPIVRIFNKHMPAAPIKEIRPYASNFIGGIILATGDVDRDGKDEILTMPRSTGGPHFRILEE